MPLTLDRRAPIELSTIGMPAEDAFAYWREVICATFVRLTAEPKGEDQFFGRIEYVPCGEIELTTVEAQSQSVRRTPSLIGRDTEEFLLTSVQLEGVSRIEQDGRIAELKPGDMAFYDTTRPYTLHSDAVCSLLVLQVPKRELLVKDTRSLTASTLGADTPGAVISTFLTSMRDAARKDPAQTAMLAPHAMGLLRAAVSFAARNEPEPDAATAFARQQITEFLRRNFANPNVDANAVAQACNLSRRSLYRIVGEEGIAAQLRRIRIQRAKEMLAHNSGQSIDSVAMLCGFTSESGFHRAFRQATGFTPGDYRYLQHAG